MSVVHNGTYAYAKRNGTSQGERITMATAANSVVNGDVWGSTGTFATFGNTVPDNYLHSIGKGWIAASG